MVNTALYFVAALVYAAIAVLAYRRTTKIDDEQERILAKSAVIGIFFAPSIMGTAGGHGIGIMPIPASIAFLMWSMGSTYTLLFGLVPMLVVGTFSYISMRTTLKRKRERDGRI